MSTQTQPRFRGHVLRQLRERSGMRREDLCSASGLSMTSLTGYELGRHEPSASKLFILARALGCAPTDLVS